MTQRALLFGGIGTLVETSELQRAAFNAAFRDAGLPWRWERQDYARMLAFPGGAARIERYAESRGDVTLSATDVQALHRAKTAHFQEHLRTHGLSLRAGVERLIADCHQSDVAVGLASTTDRQTIDHILTAASLQHDQFDVVCDRSRVSHAKPAPDVYTYCLSHINVDPANVMAFEDSESGLHSEQAAGVRCIATPGNNTREQDYSGAVAVLSCLGDGNTPARHFGGALLPAAGRLTLADCFPALAA